MNKEPGATASGSCYVITSIVLHDALPECAVIVRGDGRAGGVAAVHSVYPCASLPFHDYSKYALNLVKSLASKWLEQCSSDPMFTIWFSGRFISK